MSKCISRNGEFSEHVLTGEGSERFICQRCAVLDEDNLLAALDTAEAALDRVEALHQKHTYAHLEWCEHCFRAGDRAESSWPCATLRAVAALEREDQ